MGACAKFAQKYLGDVEDHRDVNLNLKVYPAAIGLILLQGVSLCADPALRCGNLPYPSAHRSDYRYGWIGLPT